MEVGVFNSDVKLPPLESDESNLPPTSSDRDTEDDGRIVARPVYRPRWDSGSEIDSLVSNVVRRTARRRRTPANPGEFFLLDKYYSYIRLMHNNNQLIKKYSKF